MKCWFNGGRGLRTGRRGLCGHGLVLAILLMLLGTLVGCSRPADEAVLISEMRLDGIQPGNTGSIAIEQAAGQTLLIALNGHELEFDASLLSDSSEVIHAEKTWYLRLVPLYFVLDPVAEARQVTLALTPVHATQSASVTAASFELRGGNENVAEAYRLYQSAMQATDSEDPSIWRSRVEQLQRAAELFKRAGLAEQSLWAASLVANFYYYPLYDNPGATARAREVHGRALDAGFPGIALLNLSTEGQALMERDDEDSLDETLRKQRLAQERFAQAYDLAAELGLAFEQAWALNNRGIGYYYLDEHERAIEYYEKALSEARPLGDPWFTNLVRGNLAIAWEKTGAYGDVLAVLEEVNEDRHAAGDITTLIHGLTNTGRLHRLLYRFPESIEVLDQAWALAEQKTDLESLGRIGLWQAMAYRAMGYFERAETILAEAIPRMQAVNNGRLLREAHQVAANIARTLGKTGTMQEHREAQRALSSSPANHATWFYDRGMDAMLAGEPDAAQYFRDAHGRYLEAEFPSMVWMSELRLCQLGAGPEEGSACDLDSAGQSLARLREQSPPYRELEARHAWAQALVRHGQADEAIRYLDELVDDLAYFRRELPGVLGAWYWESRNAIFEQYLELLIARDMAQGNAVESLLALDRLRRIGQQSGFGQQADEDSAALRELLARRDRAGDEEAEALEREIDRLLLADRVRSQEFTQDGDAGLQALLEMQQRGDSALLAYHLAEGGAWVWVADAGDVRLSELPDAAGLSRRLEQARANFRTVGYANLESDLEALGAGLLPGVALPEQVYLLAGGALNGFPFDALRKDGRYLVEQHDVVNLMSLAGLQRAMADDAEWNIGSAFLAGNPDVAGSNAASLAGAARELEQLAEAISGAEITRVEGAGLVRRVFESDAFGESDLVHIASHASVDMRYPELSRIALSAGEYLTPRDLASLPTQAKLVVLSACETVGSTQFSWDANLGFVSEFAGQGGTMVIASLWPVGDRFAAEFFSEFYKKTADGMAPSAALLRQKQALRNTKGGLAWAAFQVSYN